MRTKALAVDLDEGYLTRLSQTKWSIGPTLYHGKHYANTRAAF